MAVASSPVSRPEGSLESWSPAAAPASVRHSSKAFARQGAHVAFVDIDEADKPGARRAGSLSRPDIAPLFIHADLRDVEALRTAADNGRGDTWRDPACSSTMPRATTGSRSKAVTEESWDESQAVNLRHLFFMSQAVAPHMRRAGGGSIVNFSSIAFLLNMAEIPAYATAKAGIIGSDQVACRQAWPRQYPRQCDPTRHDRYRAAEEALARRRRRLQRMLEKQCLKRSLHRRGPRRPMPVTWRPTVPCGDDGTNDDH